MKLLWAIALLGCVLLALILFRGAGRGAEPRGPQVQPARSSPWDGQGAVEGEGETGVDEPKAPTPGARVEAPALPEPEGEAPRFTFQVLVLDAETGAPLEAQVEALTNLGDPHVVRGETDPRGLFRFELHAAQGSVMAYCPGYAAAAVEVSVEAAEPPVAIELPRAASLSVRILDRRADTSAPFALRVNADPYAMRGPGEPFWWTTSWLPRSWSARPGPPGSWMLEGLPPHTPLVAEVLAGNTPIHEESEALQLLPGQAGTLTIELVDVCRILGVAREVDGGAASGLEVWLLRAAGEERPQVFEPAQKREVHGIITTDDRGRFVFPRVLPGDWWVGPAPTRGRRSAETAAPLPQRLSIGDGQRQLDVTLVVHRGIFVRGRVVDPSGAPALAIVRDVRSGAWVETRGQFELGPVPPGEVQLVATPRMGTLAPSEPMAVRAGDENVVLSVRAAGGLFGRILGLDGLPAKTEVHLVPVDPRSAGFDRMSIGQAGLGTFRKDRLLPGLYHVIAVGDDGAVGRLENLEVIPGARAELQDLQMLQLSRGARVRVELPDRSDQGSRVGFRVRQAGVEMGVGGGDQNEVWILPGPALVELVAFDLETRELRVLDSHEVNGEAGGNLDVTFESPRNR